MGRLAAVIGFLALVGMIVTIWPAPASTESRIVPAAFKEVLPGPKRKAIPNVPFTDAAGAPLTLERFRGKVVLVNFWATWCAPCVREMPSLDRLQALMQGQNFEVLALSQDRNGAPEVKDFFTRQKLSNLKVYLDQGSKAGRMLKVRGLPTTILIDAEGREVARHEGPAEWDSGPVVGMLRKVVAGQ